MRLKSLLLLCSLLTLGCAGKAVSHRSSTDFDGFACTLFLSDTIESSKVVCANNSTNEIKHIELNNLNKCISGKPCKWIMFDAENFLLFQDYVSE